MNDLAAAFYRKRELLRSTDVDQKCDCERPIRFALET